MSRRKVSPEVAETSNNLKAAMGDSDPKDNEFAPVRGRPPKSAPKMADGCEHIVDRIYELPDPLDEYERLESTLKIGSDRSDYSTLNKALDEAEDNARRAHKLYLVARLDRKKWESEREIITAPMRTHASHELQREKADRTRSKQITNADVVAKMAALYPDEFEHYDLRANKLKGMEEHIFLLVELFKSRCASLQTMIRGLRR